MEISKMFKKYLERLLIWETTPVTFDRGYVAFLMFTFVLAVYK